MIWRWWSMAFVLAAGIAGPATAGPPHRVVSMNLCTDQLAMLLAGPGQLAAVSTIARDKVASAMWREAEAVPVHAGSAEAILGLRPDLVLAGAWDPPATLALLRRLGIRVETFQIERTFADVEANILHMGDVLGRAGEAGRIVEEMHTRLDELPVPAGPRPRAALYYANGYTSGSDTLADAILSAAGYANVAAERGISGMGSLPLEILVTERPDLLVLGQDYPSQALAQGILRHPAVQALGAGRVTVADSLWVCGTPRALDAVAVLAAARPG